MVEVEKQETIKEETDGGRRYPSINLHLFDLICQKYRIPLYCIGVVTDSVVLAGGCDKLI